MALAQVAKLLSWARGPLYAMEIGAGHPPSDDELRELADLYRVSVAWLRVEDVELPESTRQLLHRIEHAGDRARLTELITTIHGGQKR